MRHRVARVQREVQEDLLELRETDSHEPEIVVQLQPELHALAERLLDQWAQRRDDGVDVEQHGRVDGPPPDLQEPPRELGGAQRRAVELGHLRLLLRLDELTSQDGCVVEDHGEEIVEVVRDASRETRHVLEASSLNELRLHQAAAPLGLLALERAHQDFPRDA